MFVLLAKQERDYEELLLLSHDAYHAKDPGKDKKCVGYVWLKLSLQSIAYKNNGLLLGTPLAYWKDVECRRLQECLCQEMAQAELHRFEQGVMEDGKGENGYVMCQNRGTLNGSFSFLVSQGEKLAL